MPKVVIVLIAFSNSAYAGSTCQLKCRISQNTVIGSIDMHAIQPVHAEFVNRCMQSGGRASSINGFCPQRYCVRPTKGSQILTGYGSTQSEAISEALRACISQNLPDDCGNGVMASIDGTPSCR